MVEKKIPIYSLLKDVYSISSRYSISSQREDDSFNVFSILKLETNEVRTHSSFIAELLNPKGSHRLGLRLLQLFLEQIQFHDFKLHSITIDVEHRIGAISENQENGGYIDILIENKSGQAIIIENKIYAEDQKNQLLRYTNYALEKYKDSCRTYYLTLHGSECSDFSTAGRLKCGEHYHTLSYASDITLWLAACKKEAVDHPALRESITQYINLIKKLSDQTIKNKMEKEIAELLTGNAQNIRAAYAISQSIGSMQEKLLAMLQQQMYSVAASLHLEPKFDEEFGIYKYDTYLNFCTESGIDICFGFDSWTEGFFTGITTYDEGSFVEEWRQRFSNTALINIIGTNECNVADYPTWYYVHYFDNELSKWSKSDIWVSILDGTLSEKLKNYLTIQLEELKRLEIPL